MNIPVNEVSDSLVVSQDKAKRFELTPVWAPAEPPFFVFLLHSRTSDKALSVIEV